MAFSSEEDSAFHTGSYPRHSTSFQKSVLEALENRKDKLLSLSRKRKREASPLYDEEELVDRYKAKVKDGRRKKTTKKVSKKEEDETGQFAVSFRMFLCFHVNLHESTKTCVLPCIFSIYCSLHPPQW